MSTDVDGFIAGVKRVTNVELAIRIAYTAAGLQEYIGHAAPGSLEADSVWRIRKFTYTNNRLTKVEFADGDTQFDNSWDNRESLSYS